MKFINTTLVRPAWSVLIGLLGAVSVAHASDYRALVQRGDSQFNTVFAPNSDKVAVENGEVTLFSFNGSNTNLQWRAFLPPGTKSFQATMYTYASPPESMVIARFGTPPTGSGSDVTPEKAQRVDITQVLQSLMAGSELPFYSPASAGSMKLSSRANDITQNYQSSRGGWVYFNTLLVPGDRIFKVETNVVVDENCYRQWFASAQFDARGNPVEDAVHTCTGSTGGSTNPPISSTPSNPVTPVVTGTLTFTPSTLFKDSTTPVTISGVPAGAQCSAKSAMGYRSGYAVVDANNTIMPIQPAANSLTGINTVRIVCGTAAADLNIVLTADATAPSPSPSPSPSPTPTPTPIPTVPATVTETTDASGALTVSFKLAPASAEIGKQAKVWVGAKWSLLGTTGWIFKTDSGWMTIDGPNLGLYSFSNIAALATSQDVTVPLGLPKSDLNHYSIEIHRGYQTSDGAFQNLGKIWPQN